LIIPVLVFGEFADDSMIANKGFFNDLFLLKPVKYCLVKVKKKEASGSKQEKKCRVLSL